MYYITIDKKTKAPYMEPGESKFFVYSDEELAEHVAGTILAGTMHESENEILTEMYNAGFAAGYVDGALVKITESDVLLYDRNPNDIAYAQYLLTKDEGYLRGIETYKLYTLCKTDGNSVFFPTVKLEGGQLAVLTYTSPLRIPIRLFEKYEGYVLAKMTFNIPCIVNGECLIEY